MDSRGAAGPSLRYPLFWVKKEKVAEGKKADRRSRTKPSPHPTSRSGFFINIAACQLSELTGGKDALEPADVQGRISNHLASVTGGRLKVENTRNDSNRTRE